MAFKTEQEAFWAGSFGDEYAARNRGKQFSASQLAFFSKLISRMVKIDSVTELGANIGENLRAIEALLPSAKLTAVEINESACGEIQSWSEGRVRVFNQSILDFKAPEKSDLVFVKGVLIHINPQELNTVYELLYETSSRYILIAEYYNPTPVEVDYRGNKERLFKRDFCGEIMKAHPDLKLVDYGFLYRNDPNFPQDDITWFLLEK